MKLTLVLSDVHLSQTHPEAAHDPLWMRYRHEAYQPDDDFAALIEKVLEPSPRTRHQHVELVFNGDVFDFDSPWVRDGVCSFDEHPPTDEGCTRHVELIMADHQVFFDAAAKVLARGHTITFLSGNHDIELALPGVRGAIRRELVKLASRHSDDLDEGALGASVRFRSWFHISDDGIYFEHGSQYDIHNSVRQAAVPFTLSGDRIHPVLGKLAFRRVGGRMGYFNPYYEETFYMGLFGYLAHFARFYATKKDRHIVRTWAHGALSTIAEIWRHRHGEDRIELARRTVREELGAHITDEAIDRTHALRARPADDTMLPILRELWVDRVGLAMICLLVVFALLLFVSGRAALIALAVEVGIFVVYELLIPKPDIRTYDSAPESVLSLLEIHSVRAVCMGHTHRPFARFTDKGLYANSGSWCPAFEDQLCTKPVLDGRPVLLLETHPDDDRSVFGGLYWWRRGELTADPDAVRSRDITRVSPRSFGPNTLGEHEAGC